MTLIVRHAFCLSKQTLATEEPDVRATKAFELVHTDLAGPIDPVAKDGFKYAIIFVDDYSGCTFMYFLKEKSDVVKATEKFLADITGAYLAFFLPL